MSDRGQRPGGYDDGGHEGYYAGQGADLTPHITYFDPRTQASFVWDGVSDVIVVNLGGYAEPTDHTISSMVVVTNGRIEEHDAVRHMGVVNINWFRRVCEIHAKSLPTYGQEA